MNPFRCLLIILLSSVIYHLSSSLVSAAPTISNITDTGTIPKFDKFEVSFQVDGVQATNVQYPYLSPAAANSYLENYIDVGISVNALFLPPSQADWSQAYSQPAFYFQPFLDEQRNNQNWLYPTGNYVWKVRFAPDQIGTWQYKLVAQDKGGQTESPVQTFTVTASTNKGFLRVSPNDHRYFEFEDGTYFPNLGYNLGMNALANDSELQKLSQNHIQYIRAWLTPFNIYGSAWSAWEMLPGAYGGYLPRVPVLPLSDPSRWGDRMQFMWYLSQTSSWYEQCAFLGHTQPHPAVKPNTTYFIKARYKGANITGPRDPAYSDYGFVITIGGWHYKPPTPEDPTEVLCENPSIPSDVSWTQTTPVTTYGTTSNWNEVVGSWSSGSNNFLPNFYLALQNASAGGVYIESVEMREMTGGTVSNPVLTGPNIIPKNSPDELTYYEQSASYRLDKIMDKLKTYDIYVRPVLLEKGDYLSGKITASGSAIFTDNADNFYTAAGNCTGTNCRTQNAQKWLHEAWFRYVQARWGYSTQIHSWELLNEGDPAHRGHFALADELGKSMQCRVFGISVPYADGQNCTYDHPNQHLTSTSFWHSFPLSFFNSPTYPNVDFGDLHKYIPKATDPTHYYDTAKSTYDESMYFGADRAGGAKKPVIRAETGLVDSGTEPASPDPVQDQNGLWLHNFLWGGLNSGGLMDSGYWYPGAHIYHTNPTYDHRPHFEKFYQFIKDVPLSKGHYVDIAVTPTNPNLRIWGQKDVTNNRAHLWVAHAQHTWKNVLDGVVITPITEIITLTGFTPGANLKVDTVDTYTGTVTDTTNQTVSPTGTLTFTVSNLTADYALKIGDYTTPPQASYDLDDDGDVDFLDLLKLVLNFNSSGLGNFNLIGPIDIFDFNLLLQNL